jgi:hypothetical protein
MSAIPLGNTPQAIRQGLENLMARLSSIEASAGNPRTSSVSTQIIFNDNGVLSGHVGLTYNKTLNELYVDTIEISQGLTKGVGNTLIGNGVSSSTTGGNNTCVGKGAAPSLTSGTQNVVIGVDTLASALASVGCVAIGYQALASDNSTTGVVAIGSGALENLAGTAATHVAIGFQSQRFTTTETGCTTLGYLAGRGKAAGNGIGVRNTAIGRNALYNGTSATSDNVAIGAESMGNSADAAGSHTGVRNIAIGTNTMRGPGGGATISASDNVAVGNGTLSGVTTAGACVIVGAASGAAITTGDGNTIVGGGAGQSVTTGASNTIIGRNAGWTFGFGLTTGANNIYIGETAGSNATTGSSNICIGRASNLSGATVSNELVIGSAANFVATNGAAATYFPTATAGAVVLGNAQGFIRINLNGTLVKIPVYGN